MSVEAPGKSVLRFGLFELDLESAELRKSARVIHLQGQPFKVLALLVTHGGHVVTREQVQREVWGNDPERR